MADQCMSVPVPWVTLKGGRGPSSPQILRPPTDAKRFDVEWPKSASITRMGAGRVQTRPQSRPSVPRIFWDSRWNNLMLSVSRCKISTVARARSAGGLSVYGNRAGGSRPVSNISPIISRPLNNDSRYEELLTYGPFSWGYHHQVLLCGPPP